MIFSNSKKRNAKGQDRTYKLLSVLSHGVKTNLQFQPTSSIQKHILLNMMNQGSEQDGESTDAQSAEETIWISDTEEDDSENHF